MGQQADVLVITKNKLAEKIGSYYYIGSACPAGYRLLSVRCDDDHFYSDRTDIAYAGSGSFEVDGKIAGYCRYHALTDPILVIWNTCARFDAYPEIIKDERFMEKTEIGTLALVGGEEMLTLEAVDRDYTPVDIACRSDEGVVLGSRQNSENGAFCYFAPNQKEKTMSVRYVDFLPELQTKRDESAACDQGVCPKSDQELGYLELAMEMEEQSLLLMSGNMDKILAGIGSTPDASTEQLRRSEHLTRIDPDSRLAEDAKNALIKFISYGVDKNTKLLGAGERAAVVYSYYNAFGKMPETKSEFTDLIKIANGRWPNLRSATAEKKALEDFIRVYQRLPNMEVSYDSSAMIVMSYGLRQAAKNRNLASERQAAGTFIEIFGHGPGSTEDWNILQAITYSGATRQLDTDKDFIADSWETRLGTDPKYKDTDNDGIGDGDELKNGTDPVF
jgi:hypothetical protein